MNYGLGKIKTTNGLLLNDTKSRVKVYSLFLTSQNKHLILARQFVKMTKRELLHNVGLFWRFLDQGDNSKKNYFDIKDEDNEIRFIYQTLLVKDIYLVLQTSQEFNFFEAIDLMKTLHRVISQNLASSEKDVVSSIKMKAFDLLLLIDDIINPFGGKEISDFSKLTSNLQMESKNEKEFSIIQKEKEERARDGMIKGMEEIERLKRENKYVDNSISNEIVEVQNNQRELINEMINESRRRTGMNLKERLIQRILHNRDEDVPIGIY